LRVPRRAFLLGCNGKDLSHCIAYDEQDELQRCDVFLMRSALLELDFQPEYITIPKPRATKGELQDCLETAAYASKTKDTFVFYFSGHSMGEHGLKLLIDAPYDDARRWWAASDVVRILNDAPAGSVIMILDSCEAGQAARELAQAHEELYLLTATDRKSRAKEIEQLEAGVFTYCLHDALTRRELRTIDAHGLLDENANLGVTKLAKWLEKEVPRCGKRHGKEVPEPKLYGPHDRDAYFAEALEPSSDRQAAVIAATGYPPELINAISTCLDGLQPDLSIVRSSYLYCRARADSALLPALSDRETRSEILARLADPQLYYKAGNRLRLPLLSFAAHLNEALGRPEPLAVWLQGARAWLVETGAIPSEHVEEAARVVDVPGQIGQPYLMIEVSPDLRAQADDAYQVGWVYLDEYGNPVESADPVGSLIAHEDLVASIAAAVRLLPAAHGLLPQVEVLLPFALLADDRFIDRLEQGAVGRGQPQAHEGLRLGDLAYQYPMVLRCWERWRETLACDTRGGADAIRFWRTNAACLDCRSEAPCLVWLDPSREPDIAAAGIGRLAAPNPRRRGLAIGASRPLADTDLQDLLEAGAPVLLWPRATGKVPTAAALKRLKQTLKQCPDARTLRAMPRALREVRRAGTRRAAALRLALLWEDPDRETLKLSPMVSTIDR
jgi:hypothetical protein